MIELPEALSLAKQLDTALTGKTVLDVHPPVKPHKFCWFCGDPAIYGYRLENRKIVSAAGFGGFAEMTFDDGQKLCVNDGVNLRVIDAAKLPANYQLAMEFDDGSALTFTVQMYGGIFLHADDYNNEYYLKSKEYISPFSSEFEGFYYDTLAACKPTLSAKAFLATEQRFPGVGNGVLQDILFRAGINPRRKLDTLDSADRARLLSTIVTVLRDMTDNGGRDTEKNIYGAPGGYRTIMSKNALYTGCPVCGASVVKEAYLGGSVYYCGRCQPLDKYD